MKNKICRSTKLVTNALLAAAALCVSTFATAQTTPSYCVPTTAIADTTAAATFTAFSSNERLEVRSGKVGAADWEWGLGTNTQNASFFQNINNIDWPNGASGGLPISFTLTYNANGSGVFTLFNSSTNAQLATKSFAAPAAPATGLRVGNAIRLWVKTNAGIGVGAKMKGTINEIDGVALATPVSLETTGDNTYSEQASVIALATPANAGIMVVKGQMQLSWPGAASAIPTGSRLNATINAGTITCSASSTPQSQAITNFVSTPASPITYAPAPNDTLTLSATGGASGNLVNFASTTPAICTVGATTQGTSNSNTATVTILSAGACTLTADQAGTTTGNPTYSAAPQLTTTIAVNQASQAISGFAPASPIGFATAPTNAFVLTATGGASTSPVLFASTTPAVCITGGTNGATVSIVSPGVCSLTADQAGDNNYTAAAQMTASVNITKANQFISGFAPASPITFAAPPSNTFTPAATGGGSSNPVVFTSTTPAVCTTGGTNGATVAILAAGTCALSANQAGDTNYNAANQVSATVTINKANQTITGFNPPQNLSQTVGSTLSLIATGGASTNPVVVELH